MMPPPILKLPVPTFLGRAPGSDYEVRAWVTGAQEAVTALNQALLAATARADEAERRLAEAGHAVAHAGPSDDAGSPDPVGPKSPVADAQARFRAATDAAATVMADARAILREAREALPSHDPAGRARPGPPPPQLAPPPSEVERHPATIWGPNGSATAAAGPRPAPTAPEPARAAAPATATSDPATTRTIDARPGSPDRRIARAQPGSSGHHPSTVLPPRLPSRRSRPGLSTLFGRHRQP